MKAFLMYRDRDFDLQRPSPSNEAALTQDLELDTLFDAMALGDRFLFEVARKAVLTGEDDLDTIRYRQAILRDCLKNPAVVREIYHIPIESAENKRKRWLGVFAMSPSGVLHGAVEMLQMFVDLLKKLKTIADEHADQFDSEGFTRFFAMIKKELDDEYFAVVQDHLATLRFRGGILLSAELGQGNEATNYVLRKPQGKHRHWAKRVLAERSPVYTFHVHPRDEYGGRALAELRDRGVNLVANALAQSADHIDSFLKMLQVELAFYIGSLNLYEQLTQMGKPVCFPVPVAADARRHSCAGLYDVSLALTMKQAVVGSDVAADNKEIVIITGANQGGKSTFLRSIGLAQLMMQSGMFAPAESFCANTCERLFTHYKRKEDATMSSGKLDEELSRMSDIVDHLTPHSLVLFNESFAATNEREGSEIAGQIVSALVERDVKVFFVTHLYTLARGFYDEGMANAVFLIAERRTNGERTFRIIEGKPSQTSYGEDLYDSIFGNTEADGDRP